MLIRLGIILVSISLVIGCQQTDEERSLPSESEGNEIINVKNSDPGERKDYSNEQIANHLANLASDVPEVNDAVSIVVGPYALVGIDVDKDLDRSRVGTTKFTVLEALREDPYGKTAVVVADGDVNERIRGMVDKIQQGHPIQGIVEEVAAIVGRYMPDLPIPEDHPDAPDQNEQIIDDQEEDQLDEIKDDQSQNHRKERKNNE